MFYRDDFKDPFSGWPNSTTAKYSREGYRLTGTNVAATNGPVVRNFRASVGLSVNAPAGAGLIFRQNDKGYYALVRFKEFASVIRVEALRTVELERWPSIGKRDYPRRLEVRCEASECQFYEEEALIGGLKDTTFLEGRVGLFLSGKGDALFNDLRVEEIK